ncbi:hypothetical protein HYN48_09985 [Flavobacterium magnum]|uniref:DUF1648 domain-containing protein n=1 Tax=Flavobacterium magnum TaxID=2162713 RepID=A0A2S0RGG7_9FLAO|nr:DUF1648 domain-containing protein [Flavobacterium magnum]AWA30390.1 hypothetical protein HYN48_09985 [Flavobacterium magnum]
MKPEPRITLTLSPTDKFIELICWLSIINIWILVFVNYPKLPGIIPIHFDLSGKADGFGAKENLFALPVVTTVVAVGLTLLNRFPHRFNHLVTITPDNALRQYTMATRFIRCLKLATVLIFGLVVWGMIRSASGH